MEQRKSIRSTNKTINVEIPLSIPKGHTVIKPIYDISDGGLSFYIPNDEGFFYKDSMLGNVKIFNSEHERFVKSSRVAYCLNDRRKIFGRTPCYKIGLQFLASEQKKHGLERNKRFPKEFINTLKSRLVFTNEGGEVCSASIIDFSRYGISFSIKQSLFIAKNSFVIRDIKLIIDEQSVYSGNALVVDLKEKKDKVIVRVKLLDTPLEIEKVEHLRSGKRIAQEAGSLESILKNEENISEKFKARVADIAYLLRDVKHRLDRFEKETENDNKKNRDRLISEMFAMLEKTVFPRFDAYTDELDTLTANLNEQEHEIHKDYWQKNLHCLTIGGPLPNRIYKKPLDFPGDYEMMNMISRNTFEGKTLYDKFIHRFHCYIPAAQANRNRAEYLYAKLKEKTNEKKQDIKITSIACGSAIEIQKLIAREESVNKCDITLLDFESEALAYSKNTLSMLAQKHKKTPTLRFIQESIFTMIRKKESLNKINDKQDVIYSIGLFEYLNPSICKLLIKLLYTKLAEKGIMILGNYAKRTPFKAGLELGLEWYLIYRTNEEMLSLVDGIKEKKEVYIEAEPLGLIKFLVIKKQTGEI